MSTPPAAPSDASADLSRLSAINAALREHDPDAEVALDPEAGQMRVLTVLPPEQVMRVLAALGEEVAPAGDAAPAPAAGGSCGCGCRQR